MTCMSCDNPRASEPAKPKPLELITLGDENQPSHSLVRGHVTAEVFSEAFNAVWDGDPVHEDEIKHEYWAPTEGSKGWKKVEPTTAGTDGSQPMTVTYW